MRVDFFIGAFQWPRRVFATLLGAALAVALPARAQPQVVLSEFVANTQTNLADETGAYNDWIELFNAGTDTVNLAGWCLTDEDDEPAKWRFPATNLNPRSYLLVFASGKDRRIAGRTLHTNFKLAAEGEYLALVRPDGTRATEFSPAYPPQFPNVAYGCGMVSSNLALFATNAPARVQVPTPATYDPGWTAAGFNDSGWTAATNGVGFDAGLSDLTESSSPAAAIAAAAPLAWWRFAETNGTVATNYGSLGASNNAACLGGTTEGQPLGPSPTVGGFRGFESNNVCVGLGGSTTRVQVPHINLDFGTGPYSLSLWFCPTNVGTRGDLLTIKATGGSDYGIHVSSATAGRLSVYHNAFLGTGATPLTNGTWYAVAVTREAGGRTTCYLNGAPLFTATDTGTLTTPNDWLIGANHNGTPTSPSANFAGRIDEAAAYNRALSADEVLAQYQQALSNLPPYSAFAPTDVRAAMYGSNATALVRIPFVWPGVTDFDRLALFVNYDDGFAAAINGHEVRALNAEGATNWNSEATARHADHLAEAAEGFDVSDATAWLTPGTNVLALRGLNASATNGDFLIRAQLSLAMTLLSPGAPGYLLTPTPGKGNPPSMANLGPYLGEVTEEAPQPSGLPSSMPIAVTAAVARTVNPVASVTLSYRYMFGTETNVAMAAASNGLYTAAVPTAPLGPGQMLRWRITAVDSAGVTNVSPPRLDPTNYALYFGTVAQNPAVTSALPIFQLFIDPATGTAADSELGGRCAFFHDGEFYDNVAIEVRGNTTASLKKKSHRFEFNPGHHLRHPGPGGRIGKTSVLAEYCDPAYLRQYLSFWLQHNAGVPGMFDYPVWLTCNTTNYQLGFHSDVLGDEFLSRVGYDPNGALYKAVGVVNTAHTTTGGGMQKKTRTWEAGTADFDAMAAAIAETRTVAQRRVALFDMFNLPEVVNYLACARFTQEADDVWANMSLYRDSDGTGEWSIVPFDLNLSWGQCYYGDAPTVYNQIVSTNDLYKSHPLYGGLAIRVNGGGNFNRIYDAIITVPETRDMLLRRMRSIMDRWIQPPDTPASDLLIEAQISALTNLFWNEATLDRQLWGWPANSGPYGWGTNLWLTDGVQGLVTNYLPMRRQHFYGTHCITNTARAVVLTNWGNAGIPLSQAPGFALAITQVEANPASGNQLQEYLVISNANGFAVDASGWQLRGGIGITLEEGTVIPSNGVLYVARNSAAFRARSSGPASNQCLFVQGGYSGQLSARGESLALLDERGATNTTFSYPAAPTAAQDALRLTEIMYHPAPPTAAESNAMPTAEASDFEFLEVANVGAAPLTIGGAQLAQGVEFTFPSNLVLAAGQHIVVAANTNAFALRYGAAALTNVVGAWLGYLDNNGETLQLLDPAGENVLEFAYNNAWYPLTDGMGFSLVVRDEGAAWDTWGLKESWRASAAAGGSPGDADPAPPSIPAVRVNEALTHTDLPELDAIELYNDSTAAADIGGWFLTDDFANPKKYRIPDGTTLPAAGYAVFDASQFDPTPGAGTSFNLSSTGETVWVFSSDAATNLTGWYHGFDFGPQQNGVCFGRYITSDGREEFVTESANTLGATNAYPKVGPVVISEIVYHPPDDGTNDNVRDEFIELANFSGAAAPLFDPLFPTNTWRLRDAVDYDFPTNVTLAANGGRLLVVGFDPATNPAAAAAFFAAYGLATNTALYGPWSGKLDNSDERIELERPDTPNADHVPYILVEAVHYRDAAPWPTMADGTGRSLQRIALPEFGNDPINWFASAPTPQAPENLSLDSDGDGQPDWAEWRAQTDANNPGSCLGLAGQADAAAPEGRVVRWQSVAGLYYTVERSTNLVSGGFELLQAHIPGLPSFTTYTDTTFSAEMNYYRVKLDTP